MHSLLPLMAGLLLLAEPGVVDVQLEAEHFINDGVADRSTAEGAAQLRSPTIGISADRLVYDRANHSAVATGHVVARIAQNGLLAVFGDVVSLTLDGDDVSEVFIHDGYGLTKANIDTAAFLDMRTADQLIRTGTSVVRLESHHLTKSGDTWAAHEVELTPCDCDVTHPSWALKAASVTIDPDGKRASVLSSSIWINDVPLVGRVPVPLWIPWISVPLSDRQTGLLTPMPYWSVLNGWAVEQPVYITLGRSADLTLTPGYFFGAVPAMGTTTLPAYGIQGPRLMTEFRYTPSATTNGRVSLGLMYDLRTQRDPVNPLLTLADSHRGLRGEFGWQHSQELGRGFSLRADVGAYSDGNYQRDITPDVVARDSNNVRSAVTLSRRTADTSLSLDVVLRQDLSWGYSLWPRTITPLAGSTATERGPTPLQRLPALTFAVAPVKLLGPLFFDLTADFVRHAPLSGHGGDEGVLANAGRLVDGATELSAGCLRERLFYLGGYDPSCGRPDALRVGMADGRWQAGEREARDRFNMLPRLQVGGTLGGALSLSAWAGWRQGLWVGEASGQVATAAHPILAAQASTRLQAEFANGLFRHDLEPRLEVRAVPFALGGTPAPYDEVDLAIPDTSARVQTVAEVRQYLRHREGPSFREWARLDLGQGFELVGPTGARLGESFARASTTIGWFNASGAARLEPATQRLTRLTGTLMFADPRGDLIYAAYDNLLDAGNDATRRPIDLLFGTAVPASFTARSQLLTGGAAARFGPVLLRYEFRVEPRVWLAMNGMYETPLSLTQHSVTLGWRPACDCFAADVRLTQRLDAMNNFTLPPDFAFNLTISKFGSFGTR